MQLCLLLKKLTSAKLVMFKHNAICAKHDFYHNWQRKNTDAFICVSKLVYDLQTQGLTDEEKQKFHLVYNGIDTEKFDKYKNVKKDDNKFIVGYAGRIADDKGIDILLKAFAPLAKKYRNIFLQIAGNDEGYLQEVKRLINDNQLTGRVEYLGCLKDMELFYKGLDLFVLPSVVKESFGLVLCEAMYCGVPVITTNSGAQEEIITNGVDGVIIEPKDAEALQNNMENIYRDYDKYLKEGQYSIESGYSMMSEFIQSEDMPTAVFAASDYIAFGAMKAIKENGLKIPEDISVIGFDDAQICNYTTPTLTTIHAPAYDMGQYGANFLFGATNCSITTPLNVKMPCELVERESCGPVKNKESR